MSSLSSENIGYFDPTAISEEGHVYNDVFDFKERIETCVQQWSEQKVKPLIPACLRGDALKWYSKDLEKDTRELLSRVCSSDEWTNRLVTRFKLDKDRALTRMYGTKYRLDDAKRGLVACQYTKSILKLTKHAGIEAIQTRLSHAYYNLASEFRQDIAWRSNMTIEEFLEQLDKHQETWKERAGYYRIHRRSPPVKQTPPQNKNRGWPLQETSYQFKTPYYGTNKPANQMSAQEAMQTAPQVAPQLATRLSTPSIAELEAQAIIQSCTQLAQEATSQAANQITAYEEDLQVAIATPLPQAVECRRCLAGFSSNSQLHKHVRETHNKKIDSASKSAVPQESGVSQLVHLETKATSRAEHSASESTVPQTSGAPQLVHSETEATRASARSTRSMTAASASKSQPPPKYSASSLLSSETTSSAAPLRSVTPPPAYRATSPSPPAYQAAPKNYLTVADLYVRYAPLKSMLSTAKGSHSATQKTTVSRAYLTVQDLYEKFGKKPHSSTVQRTPDFPANRIRAFNSEQVSLSTSQASSNDKSMGKNTSKAMHSVIESPATSGDRIGLSAIKSACDSKSSAIDFFQVPKTRFFAIANPNAQRLVTQQQRQMTSSFLASPRALSYSYRGHHIVRPEVSY